MAQNKNDFDATKDDRKSKVLNDRFANKQYLTIVILLMIIGVWFVSFAILGLADPIYSTFQYFVSEISLLMNVSRVSVLAVIIFCFYMTFLIVLTRSKVMREIIRVVTRVITDAFETMVGKILKSEKSFYSISSINDPSYEMYLSTRLNVIEEKISNLVGGDLDLSLQPNKEEWDSIKKSATNAVIDNLTEEIKLGLSTKITNDKLQTILTGSLSRLSNQILVLGSRANLTLIVGVLFCCGGLFAIWYSFFSDYAKQDGDITAGVAWVDLAKVYAPRLSLVLIIEIIGFFFLKLYRATLMEIRYVQNEITNVEMKLIALNVAILHQARVLDDVIETLVKTDRNFIIDKGQTTVEIEKQRAVNESDKTVLQAAIGLLHGTEKSSFWRKS